MKKIFICVQRLIRFIPKKLIFALVFFQLCSFGLGVYTPLKVRLLFAQLIQQGSDDRIWITVSLVLVIVLGKILFDLLSRFNVAKAPNLLAYQIRIALLERYSTMPFPVFRQHKAEELASTLDSMSGDCGVYLNYVCLIVINMLNLLAMFAAAFLLSWQLALVLLCISPFMMLLNRKIGSRQQVHGKQMREKTMELQNELLYQTRTMANIRHNYAHKWHEENLGAIFGSFRQLELKHGFYNVWSTVQNDLLMLVYLGLVMGFGLYITLAGYLQVDVYLAYLAILATLLKPLTVLSGHWINMNNRLPVVEKVLALLEQDGEQKQRQEQVYIAPDHPKDAVQVRNLSFAYPGQTEDVLHGLSFAIRRGQYVAVVGPSGAGKSTLFYLLAGLMRPVAGTIAVDPGAVDLVPQVPYMFHGTVGENVRMGREASDAQILNALARAQLTGQAFALDSPVVEQGKNYSLGEKQRIGVARALLSKKTILLLDEPGANIDHTEHARMMQVIESLRNEKTIFIIAHRIETVQNADMILHLERGKVKIYESWATYVAATGDAELAGGEC